MSMTTPAEMLRKYETSPFSLYELRGKQFVILEDQPINKTMREKQEHNEKYNKDYTAFFLHIENGLFHKDLKMTETEMLSVFLNMPKGIQNLQGSIFEVDRNNKFGLKYVGYTSQDINGNPIGKGSPQVGMPQQEPQDQKEMFLTKLLNSIRTLDELGNKVDAAYVMKICENISPGKALDLFQYAKTKGVIREENGAYKVN